MSQAILVTGATGKQGGAVVNALLNLKNSSDFTILAVTRDASSSSAIRLTQKSPNIKIVQGNLDDVPAMFAEAAKMAKVWGVYSVQISQGKGVTHEGEIRQGKAMIDEAIKAGVEQFVYSSVERGGDDKSWEDPTPIPHFISKYHIEQYLKSNHGSMDYTILRPVAFMDNWAPGFPARVFLTALNNNLAPTKKLQWIATKDIGIAAASAFANPKSKDYHNTAIGLAGDDLTVEEVDQAFQNVTGQKLGVTFGIFGSALTTMVSEMGIMIRWFGTDGYGADIEKNKRLNPKTLGFEQWIREESKFEAKA